MYRTNRAAIYFSLLIVFTVNQTIARYLAAGSCYPDMVLILVVFFGLFGGMRLGFETGIVCGIVRDTLDVGFFGMHAVTMGLSGLVCGAISDKVYRENALVQMVIVFSAGLPVSGFNVTASLYTAVISPVFFFLLQRIFMPVPDL
ncbi:MAG: rod shape-determining protein MreD [Candidatus Omnitrophota bacterium]